MREIEEAVAAHLDRQVHIRRDILLALYRRRIQSPRHTENARRLADTIGHPESEIQFALDLLAEQKQVCAEGFYWRITATGCLAVEALIKE